MQDLQAAAERQERRVNESARFAAGRIASKREELQHLRSRVDQARRNEAEHRSHANEIARVYAEIDLENFLHDNPHLAEEPTA